jgi:hypothetical protein
MAHILASREFLLDRQRKLFNICEYLFIAVDKYA